MRLPTSCSYTTRQRRHAIYGDGASSFQFAYTLNGNAVAQTAITDPNGNLERKSFDANGFVTSDMYAVGQSYQQTYTYTRDPNTDLITAATDPLGRQHTYAYDANGNLTSITCQNCLAQPVTTALTYTSAFNDPATITDPNNHTWTLGYDGSGDLVSVTDPLSHQVALAYNFMGQLTSIADALGDTARFSYSFGDLAAIADPLGNVTRLFHDNAGRLFSILDALGAQTGFSHDNLDRLVRITDANGKTTAFSYDPDGDLLSVTDANNNQTAYSYDSRNRRLTRTDALGKADSYTYDANSNLTQHTDRDGNVAAYTHDGLNRRIQASFSVPGKGGKLTLQDTINYAWDGGDRLTQAVDSTAGTITRGYDGLNDLTAETSPQGTVNYTYDAGGRRASMTVAGQSAVNYAWDAANRLTGVTQGGASVGFAYDNANRRTTLTLPNGVTVAYAYDAASRVTGLTYGANGTQLGNLAYTYDADGRRTTSGGSLAAVNLPASASGDAFNADNGMTGFNGAALSYDADGNLTSDASNTYTWDARHHLAQIAQKRTTVASFVYDALGRRMSKTVGGTVTEFLYDGLNPVQELNGSSPPSPTANLLTGLGIDERFTRTDSSGAMAFMTDALGSTVGLVNAAGGIDTSYTYQPFGATTVNGTNANPYQFTGRENDATGLYFYRARYYSPTYQRFIAQDPIGFGGGDPNLYGYVWENPINWLDPDGLWGIGLIGTASAEGGLGVLGGAASANLGGGVFWGGASGINLGGFFSAGGFVGGPGLGPSYPPGNCGNFAFGAYGGVSGGAFFTNATSANDLRGYFYGLNLDLGILSLQIAWSGGTFIGAVTAGPGEIGGASGYQTNTWSGTLTSQH